MPPGWSLPALLAGDTVVLRPFPFIPLTVLRISEYIRELLPPGVFNVVSGGHDLWPWMTSHPGIDLITFTRSTNIGKPVLESAAGTLELGGNDSRAVADADPGKIALFGSLALVPVNWKPGRHGLASTLFEILTFRPVRMRTQVLVWSLARKASYDFFRLVGKPDVRHGPNLDRSLRCSAARDRGSSPISVLKILRWCRTAYRSGGERYRQRRQLMEMDDRQLKDIGITREQAAQEARKPIWKD